MCLLQETDFLEILWSAVCVICTITSLLAFHSHQTTHFKLNNRELDSSDLLDFQTSASAVLQTNVPTTQNLPHNEKKKKWTLKVTITSHE